MTTPAVTSPDLSPYAGLTLDPRTAQDFIDIAIADLQARMPGYIPLTGHTEVLLIQSLSLIVGELTARLNFVPLGVALALIGQIYGFPRDLGGPAVASAQITMTDTQNRVVPAGTNMALTLSGQQFVFFTSEDLTVAAGAGSGTVTIQSRDDTSQLNGVPAGTVLTLLDTVVWIDTVQLVTDVSGGTDVESDQDYLNRGAELVARLTSTLVTPSHFIAAALATSGVFRATAIDLYDPGSGNAPGSDAGHISIACLDPNGAPIGSTLKTSMLAALSAQASAQLILHMIDPTLDTVAVTVTVQGSRGADPATVQANVQAALTDYLSPVVWPWSGTVRTNDLIALITGVDGVDFVVELTSPTSDIELTGVAPLAQAGTLTVTVNT